MSTQHHSIVILGGGTGGLSVAARLLAASPRLDVALVERSATHHYQPLWTLVGAGVFSKEITERAEKDYVPDGCTWIKDAVVELDPEHHAVKTAGGATITYDQLVVALGMQLDWGKIKGLDGNLGKDGVVSNYDYAVVDRTYAALSSFTGGNALFTFPSTPVKCAGAPQKIMYLADEIFRRNGVRDRARIIYTAAGAAIFGVKKYARTLNEVVARKGIETRFRHDLVELRVASKEAVFQHLDEKKEVVLPYALIHVVPPQSAPDLVKRSALAGAAGWVDVDRHSLQHVRYPNVFSLGDCSSLPTSRTGAAIRKQAPVLVDNLLALRAGCPLAARYDGYTSCPLITGFGKLVLAEFDYDGTPCESFSFDQSQERYSMYALKAYALPELYWNGMLRGRM